MFSPDSSNSSEGICSIYENQLVVFSTRKYRAVGAVCSHCAAVEQLSGVGTAPSLLVHAGEILHPLCMVSCLLVLSARCKLIPCVLRWAPLLKLAVCIVNDAGILAESLFIGQDTIQEAIIPGLE